MVAVNKRERGLADEFGLWMRASSIPRELFDGSDFELRIRGDDVHVLHVNGVRERRQRKRQTAQLEILRQRESSQIKSTVVASTIAGIFAVAAALGAAWITASDVQDAQQEVVTLDCIDVRSDTIQLLEESNGVWVPLPSTSPEEKQCKINSFVKELGP